MVEQINLRKNTDLLKKLIKKVYFKEINFKVYLFFCISKYKTKSNEKYLKEFLEALLKIHIEKIDIRSEVGLLKLDEKEKGGRLDLEAKLNDGLIVNIEMQLRNLENMEKRTMYYASKILSREVERGEKYEEINPIIMVNILDYEIFGFKEYVHKTEIVKLDRQEKKKN